MLNHKCTPGRAGTAGGQERAEEREKQHPACTHKVDTLGVAVVCVV